MAAQDSSMVLSAMSSWYKSNIQQPTGLGGRRKFTRLRETKVNCKDCFIDSIYYFDKCKKLYSKPYAIFPKIP